VTKRELEKKLGKEKVAEIEAYVQKTAKQLGAKGKSPDEIASTIKARYPQMTVLGIFNWMGRARNR
jgi:uncharacterized protein (DUF885 family)